MSLPQGKGVYAWNTKRLGSPAYVTDLLVGSGTEVVAVKIHDAGYVWDGLEPYIEAFRAAGIAVGAWGYVYLKWNALAEAIGAVKAIKRYKPDFYLIDAEVEAKFQWAPAKVFANYLRSHVSTPIGLSSYWKPTWHQELPWTTLRGVSQFDAPQVYWRGYNPIVKLQQSKLEFSKMSPRLPFSAPGGDMYLDRGLKPTTSQVIEFLAACRQDPEIKMALMWSLDQYTVTPELWQAYSNFRWHDGSVKLPPELPPIPQPDYIAVVNAARGLNVRRTQSTAFPPLRALPRGTRVEVWHDAGLWSAINQAKTEWVYDYYITQV